MWITLVEGAPACACSLCLLALHIGPLLKAVDLERPELRAVPAPLPSLCLPQPGSAAGDWQGFN